MCHAADVRPHAERRAGLAGEGREAAERGEAAGVVRDAPAVNPVALPPYDAGRLPYPVRAVNPNVPFLAAQEVRRGGAVAPGVLAAEQAAAAEAVAPGALAQVGQRLPVPLRVVRVLSLMRAEAARGGGVKGVLGEVNPDEHVLLIVFSVIFHIFANIFGTCRGTVCAKAINRLRA